MEKRVLGAKVTLWATRVIAFAVTVLIFTLPAVVRWYAGVRTLTGREQIAILIGFYCCAPAVLFALWNMDRLLAAILAQEVFTRDCVCRIRRVQWCCGAVTVFSAAAAFFYLPHVFMAVIMGFLFLTVCTLGGVMDAAVTLREENDLTI